VRTGRLNDACRRTWQVQSIVAIVGPVLFGSLYGWVTKPPLSLPQIPFIASAALSLLSLMSIIFYLGRVIADAQDALNKEARREEE
jgi:hypothetical protein